MISAEILRQHLPPAATVRGGAAHQGKKEEEERPQQQPAIFLCGPPGLERAARKMLGELGHPPERLADF
jgi:ferredoxin-NADP reductase